MVELLVGFLVGVVFTIIFYSKDKIENLLFEISDLNETISYWTIIWSVEFENNKEMIKILEEYKVDVSKWKHKILGED